jgi:hypothetical protein
MNTASSLLEYQSKQNKTNKKEVKEIENLLTAYQYAKRYRLTQKGLFKSHEILAAKFTNITKRQKGKYRKTMVGIRGWSGLVYDIPNIDAVSENTVVDLNIVGTAILISPLPSIEVELIVLMFTPLDKASCLPLNVVQLAELNAPLLAALAVGRLKV